MSEKASLFCHVCDKQFSKKFNLVRHLGNVHKINRSTNNVENSPAYATSRLVCTECPERFNRHSQFVGHLKEIHSFDLPVEVFTFTTEDDFLNWKYDLQKKSLVEYTKESNTKTLSDGTRKVYLVCHRLKRPNQHVKKPEDRKRALKSQGSKKKAESCPSRIEVVYNKDLTVSVKHWTRHFGHLNDLGHSSLDKPTKDNLARRLQDGVSFEHILDDVRTKEPDNPRTLLLDRKDLHNVVRDYNLSYDTKRHAQDGLSVKIWVDEMMKLGEESPVLFFKQQGEVFPHLDQNDFILILMTSFQSNQIVQFGSDKICVDDTHGTNGYDIHLVTLLTVDEFGGGVPVAYCFSSKCDENHMSVFFEKVKEKVGVVSCTTFMSDDAPAFYNAWEKVMGHPDHKLLCSWHVDRCWRKNLNKVKGCQEKKTFVYKTLKVLMQSLTETGDFGSLLTQTVSNLLNDPDTLEYGEYFVKHYAGRPEQWAYCFRVGLGINTNMYLESFHRTLKHVYLEGKKVKRLDKTINAVMKMARDCLFKRLIKLSKQTPSQRILRIKKSHKASEAIGPSAFKVVSEGEEWQVTAFKVVSEGEEWQVTSSNGVETYTITKSQTSCEDTCMKCAHCRICIHSFKCSCTDNVIKLNICKHIHACCRIYDLAGPEVNCEHVNNVNLLLAHTKINSDVGNSQKIVNKVNTILDLVNRIDSISDSDCRLVERKLDGAISMLNKLPDTRPSNKFDVSTKVNTNKKIDPQVRLFSLKKKVKTLKRLKKPTYNEGVNIIQGLKSENQTVMNIHTENDHTYISDRS